MDPIPGRFHEEDGDGAIHPDNIPPATFDRSGGEEIKFSLEVHPDQVVELTAFREAFNPKTGLVYYPCCGQDASPSQVFHDRVVYLDGNPKCVEAFKQAGYEAYEGDANDFNPGVVDITLVYNPQISPKPFFSHIKEGGYLVCNNYHSTADFMRTAEEFDFVGAVVQNGKVNRENLDDFWEEVETDEELRSTNPHIADMITENVHLLTGKIDHILSRYRTILQANPSGIIMRKGKVINLWRIPKKKTAMTYVFQRKSFEKQQ